MKKVTVTGGMQGEWILLQSFEDLEQYMEYTAARVSDQTRRLIQSRSPVERWDHMTTQTPEGSVLSAALIASKFKGGNVIGNMDQLVEDKYLNMFNHLYDGHRLLVNALGGYCPMKDTVQILLEEEMELRQEDTHLIREGTRYLNLENDPSLETYTITHLGQLDPNFSYVLNFYRYPTEKLEAVMKEFVERGGIGLYQYTTGTNVPQMYSYIDMAYGLGMRQFIFVFNEGINQDIQVFIDYVSGLEGVNLVLN